MDIIELFSPTPNWLAILLVVCVTVVLNDLLKLRRVSRFASIFMIVHLVVPVVHTFKIFGLVTAIIMYLVILTAIAWLLPEDE